MESLKKSGLGPLILNPASEFFFEGLAYHPVLLRLGIHPPVISRFPETFKLIRLDDLFMHSGGIDTAAKLYIGFAEALRVIDPAQVLKVRVGVVNFDLVFATPV